jgi:hypothetical protein
VSQRAASRLAWGIGVLCGGCVIASLVLLVLGGAGARLSDRVYAQAGSVEVTSRTGVGTRIRGSVPVPAAVVAA